jgi:hypothetical protein
MAPLSNVEMYPFSRKGPVIAVTSENDPKHLRGIANEIIVLTKAPEYEMPVPAVSTSRLSPRGPAWPGRR